MIKWALRFDENDVCVDGSELLIDLDKITVPTLVICGDKDQYLDYGLVKGCLDHLPDGSKLAKNPVITSFRIS